MGSGQTKSTRTDNLTPYTPLCRSTSFRTSETVDVAAADPGIGSVEALTAAFTGLDRSYGEPVQGQRYAVGQEFKAHTDYFEPGGADYKVHCRVTGNRTWTVMIYLNQPGAGGATRFKAIDKTIQPETGKLDRKSTRLNSSH